jgi:predicted Fe-Mo cluster-binding NifX family protein
MKIAVPTNDGTSISEHFGRSAGFIIFDTENGQIKSQEVKSNTAQHSHEQGACGHESADHKPHSHAGILAVLDGCQVVICAGMGQRAAEALKASGAEIVITAPAPAQETVTAYLAGKLSTVKEGLCRCSH